jgi:peptide deformylase
MKVWDERCLVLPPNFHAVVMRDARITVEFNNLNGDTKTITLSHELSRALQHEMDHDRGILILDHIGLDEMESEQMRQIEMKDHSKRMHLAYLRP